MCPMVPLAVPLARPLFSPLLSAPLLPRPRPCPTSQDPLRGGIPAPLLACLLSPTPPPAGGGALRSGSGPAAAHSGGGERVQTGVCPDRDVRTRLPAARADLAGVLGRQGAYQQLRHPLAALPQAWNRAPLAYGSAVARRGCGSRWRTARSSRAIRSPDETSACACGRANALRCGWSWGCVLARTCRAVCQVTDGRRGRGRSLEEVPPAPE